MDTKSKLARVRGVTVETKSKLARVRGVLWTLKVN